MKSLNDLIWGNVDLEGDKELEPESVVIIHSSCGPPPPCVGGCIRPIDVINGNKDGNKH